MSYHYTLIVIIKGKISYITVVLGTGYYHYLCVSLSREEVLFTTCGMFPLSITKHTDCQQESECHEWERKQEATMCFLPQSATPLSTGNRMCWLQGGNRKPPQGTIPPQATTKYMRQGEVTDNKYTGSESGNRKWVRKQEVSQETGNSKKPPQHMTCLLTWHSTNSFKRYE